MKIVFISSNIPGKILPLICKIAEAQSRAMLLNIQISRQLLRRAAITLTVVQGRHLGPETRVYVALGVRGVRVVV